ncbi:MAG: DUF4843 domain-containing protein [Marinifilaceae bacterium]
MKKLDMNKIHLLFIFLLIVLSCSEQAVDTAFEETDGIYFSGNMTSGIFSPVDSLKFSLGLRPKEIVFDTVRLSVTYIGRQAPHDRHFKVEVVEANKKGNLKTSMIKGKHYLPLADSFIMPANSYITDIDIIIDRSNFSTSFRKAEEHTLVLRLGASDDFSIGIEAAQEIMIRVDNYMSEPSWWDLENVPSMQKKLGFYHPEKWKALMFVDARFNDPYKLGFELNNGAIIHTKVEIARKLDPWWPKVDEETGELVYFDRIEQPTDLEENENQ